jgi:peptide/nickel transport system permease protein
MPVSLRYVVLRLLQIVPTFLLIMVVMFVLVRLLPGDPTSALLGERATDEAVARINAQYGLDKPIPVQFGIFLENFFRGDLGDSIVLKTSVLGLILNRMPVTLFLTALAALLSVVMAVPLAFVAALRHGSGTDSAIRAGFQVGL